MTSHDIVRTFDKVVSNLFNVIVLGSLPLFAVGMLIQPFAR
jgi:hypothetical protein